MFMQESENRWSESQEELAPIRFFWYGEASEIFAAHDVRELYTHLCELLRELEEVPELTERNRGEVWDIVDGGSPMGDRATVAEALATGMRPPCQVATGYD
jgi:hypothetical protein